MIAVACVSCAPALAPSPVFAIDAMADHAQHMALLGAPIPKPETPAPAAAVTTRAAPAGKAKTAPAAPAGLVKQTSAVQTNCFTAPLRAVLADMQGHFGRPVIVTSGYRSHSHNRRAGGAKRSMHTTCMAADVQISGVSAGAIARWARSHPSVGGVGSYRHTRSVHVDVGVRTASWGRRGQG